VESFSVRRLIAKARTRALRYKAGLMHAEMVSKWLGRLQWIVLVQSYSSPELLWHVPSQCNSFSAQSYASEHLSWWLSGLHRSRSTTN